MGLMRTRRAGSAHRGLALPLPCWSGAHMTDSSYRRVAHWGHHRYHCQRWSSAHTTCYHRQAPKVWPGASLFWALDQSKNAVSRARKLRKIDTRRLIKFQAERSAQPRALSTCIYFSRFFVCEEIVKPVFSYQVGSRSDTTGAPSLITHLYQAPRTRPTSSRPL